jgi:cytosine/adenosine deaminase-related metal-dependent hydrolase
MKSDVVVAGGSDAPIESCSPFTGIHDAIERRSRSDTTGEQYRPEECLTFSEALWAYTVGAAFAAECERDLGCIEDGFAADFAVISRSVLTDVSLLRELQSELVCVGGKVTYFRGEPDEQKEMASSGGATTPGDYIPGKNGARPILPATATPGFGWSACKCCRQKY